MSYIAGYTIVCTLMLYRPSLIKDKYSDFIVYLSIDNKLINVSFIVMATVNGISYFPFCRGKF